MVIRRKHLVRFGPQRTVTCRIALSSSVPCANSHATAQALKECIKLLTYSLELFPPGHPNRDTSLNNLAGALGTRNARHGERRTSMSVLVSMRRYSSFVHHITHFAIRLSITSALRSARDMHAMALEVGDLDWRTDRSKFSLRDAVPRRASSHSSLGYCMSAIAHLDAFHLSWHRF